MRENLSDLGEDPTYANPTYPRFTVCSSLYRHLPIENGKNGVEIVQRIYCPRQLNQKFAVRLRLVLSEIVNYNVIHHINEIVTHYNNSRGPF